MIAYGTNKNAAYGQVMSAKVPGTEIVELYTPEQTGRSQYMAGVTLVTGRAIRKSFTADDNSAAWEKALSFVEAEIRAETARLEKHLSLLKAGAESIALEKINSAIGSTCCSQKEKDA